MASSAARAPSSQTYRSRRPYRSVSDTSFSRYTGLSCTSSRLRADASFATRPDLLLIDGGRGHLNAVLEVMLQLGVEDVSLASIAKQEELLRFLRDRGRVRPPDIEKALRVTRSRVSQVMQPLVEAGLVVRQGQTRSTTYVLNETPSR